MKVGVLLPVRNALSTIETCLASITDQTYDNTHVYVVDDASDDGTGEFLDDRPDWYHMLGRFTKRVGWPRALNSAARIAIYDGCDALFVMNADDFLRLDCIGQCVDELSRCPAIAFTVPLVQQIGGENVVQQSQASVTLGDFVDHTPLVAFCMIRSAAWETVDGYHVDVNLSPLGNEDPMAGYNEIDFYIRLLKAGYRYTVLNHCRPLVYYRMHPDQLHRSIVSRHNEALTLIHRKHPEILTTPPWREEQEGAPGND